MMNETGPPPSAWRAWCDLARAGNFPSVASNVLAALVLSTAAGSPMWPPAGLLGLALLAGCLVYAGGATLNDVADAAFDAQHRPERVIPRKIVSRRAAGAIGALEMVLGLELLVAAGASVAFSVALAATILAYDWIHKRWKASVVLMAGCRGLLALTLSTLPGHEANGAFFGWVAGLCTYIVSLSLIARREYEPGAPAARLGRMVGGLLAFIPLIDAVALLVAGAWWPAGACAAAVPLGRWAQRLAAAT